jgi:hypothetical protein
MANLLGDAAETPEQYRVSCISDRCFTASLSLARAARVEKSEVH